MAQCFLVANINKCEFLNPNCFGDSLQQKDWKVGRTLAALAILVTDGNSSGDIRKLKGTAGSWAGDRIVIPGDLGEPGYLLPEKWFDLSIRDLSYSKKVKTVGELCPGGKEPPNLYHLARMAFKDISEAVAKALKEEG